MSSGLLIDANHVAVRTRALRCAVIVAFTALLIGIGTAGAAASSRGEPTAVASKSKCTKGSRWRCAPKRYHLSARGTFRNLTYSEDWSAEIDLGKRRASPGTVDYAQDGGQVAVSGSGTFTYSHGCLSLDGYPTYNLPQQTLHVPREGLNDADFGVTFKLKLNGIGKNQYGLSVGAVQPEFSNIKGIGTVTCPEGTSHTEEYAFINTIQTVMALVEPGKVGDSPLNGSAQAGFHTVSWSLTVKK